MPTCNVLKYNPNIAFTQVVIYSIILYSVEQCCTLETNTNILTFIVGHCMCAKCKLLLHSIQVISMSLCITTMYYYALQPCNIMYNITHLYYF